MIVAIVFALCIPPIQTIYDGELAKYKFSVFSSSGTPIQSVSCEAFWSTEQAEQAFEYLIPPENCKRNKAVQDPFENKDLEVEVQSSFTTRKGILTSSERRVVMHWALVIVTYENGERKGRLIELPDIREKKRSLQVEMP